MSPCVPCRSGQPECPLQRITDILVYFGAGKDADEIRRIEASVAVADRSQPVCLTDPLDKILCGQKRLARLFVRDAWQAGHADEAASKRNIRCNPKGFGEWRFAAADLRDREMNDNDLLAA